MDIIEDAQRILQSYGDISSVEIIRMLLEEKQVQCEECDGMFPRGECHRRTNGPGDPTDEHYYLCRHCNEEQERKEEKAAQG